MPYGGEKNQGQVERIERCVQHLMSKGHDKVTAIKMCKASVLKGRRVKT